MEALVHNDIHDFLATAGAFLNADPVNHSVHLTTLDAALRGQREPATLISLHEGGNVVGAAHRSVRSCLPTGHTRMHSKHCATLSL